MLHLSPLSPNKPKVVFQENGSANSYSETRITSASDDNAIQPAIPANDTPQHSSEDTALRRLEPTLAANPLSIGCSSVGTPNQSFQTSFFLQVPIVEKRPRRLHGWRPRSARSAYSVLLRQAHASSALSPSAWCLSRTSAIVVPPLIRSVLLVELLPPRFPASNLLIKLSFPYSLN